jgi:hypothetical protein
VKTVKTVFVPHGYPVRSLSGIEQGAEVDLDVDGNTVAMRPARRFPDGLVEVVGSAEALEAVWAAINCTPVSDLWAEFHAAGFTDIWYAHPGPHCYKDYQLGRLMDHFGPRWHAGIWTGPEHDLVCVRACSTNKEANRYLSPGGWSPEEAVRCALAKRRELGGGS